MTNSIKDFDLGQFLPYRLSVSAEQVSATLARDYRERFGISTAEWRVLAHIAHAGAVSVREIEHQAHLEKSKASRAAKRLEAEGYISKAVNEGDRRLLVLQLTDAGRALMADLLPRAMAYQSRLEQRLAPELDALERALDKLMEEDTDDQAL